MTIDSLRITGILVHNTAWHVIHVLSHVFAVELLVLDVLKNWLRAFPLNLSSIVHLSTHQLYSKSRFVGHVVIGVFCD